MRKPRIDKAPYRRLARYLVIVGCKWDEEFIRCDEVESLWMGFMVQHGRRWLASEKGTR